MEKFRILRTNTSEYFVNINEDGTLHLSRYKGDNFTQAGNLIKNLGGIQAVLDMCEEFTEEELQARYKEKEEARKRAKENAKQYQMRFANMNKEAFKELQEKGEVIETTFKNIGIVLRYLKETGMHNAPKMSIPYNCNEYDCEGTTAITMTLEKPIEFYGQMISKFQVGAPKGHLMKYHRV